MFRLDIQEQTITIKGKEYQPDVFRNSDAEKYLDSVPADLFLFLREWFSDSPLLRVKTSGSTGIPKELYVEKSRMMHSAKITCSFLGLKGGDVALLCLPLDYIAGKMMVVRSLVCGLDLYPVEPSSNPLSDTDIRFDFAALIPMQVYNILKSDVASERLRNIKNLIIGGGFIDKSIEAELISFPHNIYATYGMTETLSHIALRKINGDEASASYHVFEGIQLSTTADGALIIDAPALSDEVLVTNDVVRLSNDRKTFEVIGRKDNIINTGGIKVQIEEIESKLKPIISGHFAISSMPDVELGEAIVLVLEESSILIEEITESVLSKYSIPKRTIRMSQIPLTDTGKISRKVLKELILSLE